jgi:DHA1 family bicyclomycin/chloramphenicol resistance-like MFS transporter
MVTAAPRITPRIMHPALIILLLALLLGVQPITTDLYLPALPDLTHELGAGMVQAQLTLTALLLAYGVSQLVWGPLSDRFGRRPILLIGMIAYTIAALGSAFAPSMDALIAWRTLQGAAMGAGVMCARAIIRDLYSPAQGAMVISKALSGLGVIACISAPLGGFLTAWFNWHIALLVLAVFGAISLGLIALRFEESIPQKNPNALQLRTMACNWLHIVRNPTFLAFSALTVCSYSGLFSFLASSSFVLIRVLGLSTTEYGMVMFGNSFIYLLGTFLCRHLLRRFGVRRAVAIAGGLTFCGGGGVVLLAVLGMQSVWAIEIPFALFMLAHGIHNPCGQSGSVAPFPQAAGAASALNGFLVTISAFATGQWLGSHIDGTIWPLVIGIGFWSAMIALVAWTLVQRYAPSP